MVHESLSALLDGECAVEDLDRLLDEIDRDPELKAAWSRMCQARDAQEGTRLRKQQPCICAGVMSQLDAPASEQASPKVVPFAAAPSPVSAPVPRPLPAARRRADWRTWSGWAVAASVAVFAVALNLGGNRDDVPGAESAPGFVPAAATPVSVPVIPGPRRGMQVVSLSPDEQAVDDDLRNYLIEHSNALADRGMGTLSYARFAAHTADLQSQSLAQPAVFNAGGQP